MIEDIIRDTLRTYSYSVSDQCIEAMAWAIELHLDSVGWVASE